MKQLEDRIKDRLEGYESSLPEGDFAEFKALLDVSASSGTKRMPAYIAWLAPVAVAAGLAMFFIFGHGHQQDVIQAVEGNSMVTELVEITSAEPVNLTKTETVEDAASAHTESAGIRSQNRPYTTATISDEQNSESHSDISERALAEQIGNDEQPNRTEHNTDEKPYKDNSSMNSSEGHSPLVPSGRKSRKTTRVKVGQATAGVLGGTGALALASVLPSLLKNNSADADMSDAEHAGNMNDSDPLVDAMTGNDTHYMPLRAGLSLRIPFNERWSMTTGLDYSWYASKLEYSHTGIHKQSAHYLDIPLRADFTITRNRRMNVYVGAGASIDYCVAAYDAGQKKAGDGFGFSLIGTGGIQFNISRNLGLFLDPTFSWDIPSEHRVLDTFRSEHPFMFSVSTGLRVTLPSGN